MKLQMTTRIEPAGLEIVAATPADAGVRLDRFLAERLGSDKSGETGKFQLTRSRLKSLIEAGHVSANGATITEPATRVKPGTSYQVSLPPAAPARPEAQAIALNVRHEDADLIVIDKPAGLVMHPAPGNADHTLVNALIAHCGASLSGIGGEKRPGIVHRLDKDTSGLVVAAKNDFTHHALARQFHDRSIERRYLALAHGVVAKPEGDITGAIGRDPRARKRMAVVSRGGKVARTHYKRLEIIAGAYSLLECRLATGRTHQIRVHLAHMGHPLVGDPVYGRSTRGNKRCDPATAAFSRQALHARTLGFVHPRTQSWLEFESRLPADFANLLDALRRPPLDIPWPG
jgi:23S rRNA pseudouridine1911/1915/1917 synthase